jgi:plastocyanin
MNTRISRRGFLTLLSSSLLGSYAGLSRSLATLAGDPPVLTQIIILPPLANLVPGDTAVFIAIGKDQYGNTYPLTAPVWEGTGGDLTPVGSSCAYQASEVGNFQITCRQGGTSIGGTAQIYTTAVRAVLTRIEVTPSSVNLVVGQSQAFNAAGRDQFGNPYLITEPRWTTSGGGTIEADGVSCTYTATSAGNFTITCTQEGTTIQGTGNIATTNPAVLTSIVMTPSSVNLVVGQSQLFTATGKDQLGNNYPISNPVWSTSGGGTLEASGTSCTYTATSAGNFTITCTQEGTTIQGTANIVTTNPAVLTSIVMTPSTANLVVGNTAVFTATGKDQFGNNYPISNLIWNATGGASVPVPNSAQMNYTAGTLPGRYEVVAAVGQVVGRAVVVITGAAPPALAPGESWEHAFTTSGVYPYYDPYVPRHAGTVVVTSSLRGASSASAKPLLGTKQSPSSPEEIASHTPLAMTTEVTITDAGFEPPTVTIAISDTVRWTNRGASVHAVAGGAPRRRYLPLVLR